MKKILASENFQFGLAIVLDAIGEFLKLVGVATIFCVVAMLLPTSEDEKAE